jgi:hypothetical protein
MREKGGHRGRMRKKEGERGSEGDCWRKREVCVCVFQNERERERKLSIFPKMIRFFIEHLEDREREKKKNDDVSWEDAISCLVER